MRSRVKQPLVHLAELDLDVAQAGVQTVHPDVDLRAETPHVFTDATHQRSQRPLITDRSGSAGQERR
jgi:hypothetical protein